MWTGTDARALLASSRQFVLHSQFSSSLNLQTGGRLLHITSPSAAPVRVECPFGIEVEAGVFAVFIREARKHSNSATRWNWDAQTCTLISPGGTRASSLIEPTDCTIAPLPVQQWGRALRALRAFLPPLEWLLAHSGLTAITSGNRAVHRLRDLTEAWIQGDCMPASWLLGRGPGLTPSGDDFLIGILGVLARAGQPDRSKHACCSFREAYGGQINDLTTDVSTEYLLSAFRGNFSGPIRRLLNTAGKDRTATHRAISQLEEIGHTSGVDTLAGISIALESLLGNDVEPLRKESA